MADIVKVSGRNIRFIYETLFAP